MKWLTQNRGSSASPKLCITASRFHQKMMSKGLNKWCLFKIIHTSLLDLTNSIIHLNLNQLWSRLFIIQRIFCGVEKLSCTSFVDLLCHHLSHPMPLLQHLNQALQCLIISWVHELTGRDGWKAFYDSIQQSWVIHCVGKKKKVMEKFVNNKSYTVNDRNISEL